MAKKVCVVCEKELGLLTPKVAIADGFVCGECLKRGGMTMLGNPQSRTAAYIKEMVNSRIPLLASFTPTKKPHTTLQIDENSRTFMVGQDLFAYENLLSFELLEDGNTITKGGIGHAVVGGLLFGGFGALLGGVAGNRKTKATCTTMRIRITMRNAHTDMVYINLITSETKKNSIIYKGAVELAQRCLSALQIITDDCESRAAQREPAQAAPAQTVSAADEIMKFKQLLDAGVISEEEFNEKKKQLLGL